METTKKDLLTEIKKENMKEFLKIAKRNSWEDWKNCEKVSILRFDMLEKDLNYLFGDEL